MSVGRVGRHNPGSRRSIAVVYHKMCIEYSYNLLQNCSIAKAGTEVPAGAGAPPLRQDATARSWPTPAGALSLPGIGICRGGTEDARIRLTPHRRAAPP